MAIAKHIGYDTTGRPDENEFPEILEAWRSFKKKNRVDFFANAPLCFAIERGECKGRLDVQFYQPEYIGLEKQILSLPYPAYKLQDLAGQIVDGPFGTQLKVEEYVNEGIPVVRVSDVKTGELVDNNLVFITPKKHKQLIRSQVLPGDVILTKAGAILGYSAVFPDRWNEGNITSHSVTIRCRAELNPYYLSYYLRSTLGNRQVYRWGNKSTRPELNTAEVGELLTVVPPRHIQDKIANVMDEAYRIKKEKETEAESILNSIEEYVLDKLGIKVPQIKDERTFTVTADAIYGSRFDPFYYQPKHTIIQKAISGGKYRPEFLKNLIVDYFKGILPKFEEKGDDVNVLQIRNLTRHGDFDLSDILTAKSFYAQKNPRARLQKGDLIIVITGATIGKVAIYDMDMEFYLSGDMIRLRIDKSKANNYFIFETLLTEIGQTQIMQNITGATNKHLSLTDLLSSKSPLPPISIQEKIAEDVQVKRQHVKKLKQEAQELLQVAKEKAEQMILGVESA